MDAESFTTIATAYRRRMIGYARRRLTLADSEDVVQDALLGVLDADLPADRAGVESMVFGILKRRIIDLLRRRGRRPTVLESECFAAADESGDDHGWRSRDRYDGEPLPEESIIRREEVAALQSAIVADINAREATDGRILRAVFLEGMDAEQAAECCGVPRQRVYEAKFWGIKRLRERLAVA
jgi:RNA polymerase sigma factor (sigma-70 family)